MKRISISLIILATVGCFILSGCEKEKAKKAKNTKKTDEIFAGADYDFFKPFADPDRSFCLLNEGVELPVMDQTPGSCWAYASVTSMESSYKLKTGKKWIADPQDIVNNVYFKNTGHKDKEGLYISSGEPGDYGGGSHNILSGMGTNPVNGCMLSDMNIFNEGSIDTVKKMIREHGAVSCSINSKLLYSQSKVHGYKTHNYVGKGVNHVVVIVGWDDDFPANIFMPNAKQKGAWLVQNSHSESFGNKGYFWMSYDIAVTGVIYVPTDEFKKGQNHGTYAWESVNPEGNEVTYASVYEINGKLGAVGILTGEDEEDLSYTVEILDGKFGKELLSFSGKEEMYGYHLAKLPKELEVDTCTIVIHKSKNVPVEGESKELDMGNLGQGKIYNYTKTEPGRCYIMIDGKWVDTASEEAKEKLDIDYIPGDICMPVLYN